MSVQDQLESIRPAVAGLAGTSTVQDEEQTGAGDQSSDTTNPQTGDSSNMMLWISLMLASCGGVLGMLFYRRKKAAAGK